MAQHRIEKAIEIAFNAHKGQLDKAGLPYILHPLHIMDQVDTENEKVVGVLHDVVEDSGVTVKDIHEALEYGNDYTVANALTALTHKKDVDYLIGYISVIRDNPLARRIKIEDLKHNLEIRRLRTITDKDLERVRKYKKALEMLGAV